MCYLQAMSFKGVILNKFEHKYGCLQKGSFHNHESNNNPQCMNPTILSSYWNWKKPLKIIKKFGHGFGIVGKPSMNRILWQWLRRKKLDLRSGRYWILSSICHKKIQINCKKWFWKEKLVFQALDASYTLVGVCVYKMI